MNTQTHGKSTLSGPTESAMSSGAPVLESFDLHASGQLRIGATGDQLELLPIADEHIAPSSGPPLASRHLAPAIDCRGDLYRAAALLASAIVAVQRHHFTTADEYLAEAREWLATTTEGDPT